LAYVAVKGGDDAVEKSIALLERYRTRGDGDVRLEALEKRMSLLIDRVMSEAGFYAPRYAALALKQSEGALEEAVFLLRAYRSALSRDYRSLPMDGADMVIHRRISAAFKDVEGGQFLGATYDYTHRLLNFDLLEEKSARLLPIRRPGVYRPAMNTADKRETSHKPADGTVITAPRVSQELREEGLLTGPETPRRRIPGQAAEPMAAGTGRETDIKTQAEYPGETETPADITRHPIHFPASRDRKSTRLNSSHPVESRMP
jgi:alpha-D-ribose 1-methylphosphonate 5-triphosphate synthase subunit PhnI